MFPTGPRKLCHYVFVALCLTNFLRSVECLQNPSFFLWPNLQEPAPELVPGDRIDVVLRSWYNVEYTLSIEFSSENELCEDCVMPANLPATIDKMNTTTSLEVGDWAFPCRFVLHQTDAVVVYSGWMLKSNSGREATTFSAMSSMPTMPPPAAVPSSIEVSSWSSSSGFSSIASSPPALSPSSSSASSPTTATPTDPIVSPIDFAPACPALQSTSIGIGIGIGTVVGTLLATLTISYVLLLHRRRSDRRRQKYMSKPLPPTPKVRTPWSTSKFSAKSKFSAPPVYQSPQRKGGQPTGLRRQIAEKEMGFCAGSKPLTEQEYKDRGWL